MAPLKSASHPAGPPHPDGSPASEWSPPRRATGRPLSAADLRAAGRAASAGSELRSLLDRAAAAIDDLEEQRDQLEMSVSELQAGYPVTEERASSREVTEAVTAWLDAIDPSELERMADPAISRAFIEASAAADRITTEAIARAERLIDHVAGAAAELLEIVAEDADSAAVSQWQSRFVGSSRAIITQLRLPSTLAVANLIELLSATSPSASGRRRRQPVSSTHSAS
ncbi:MAG: hypothetical protein ACYDH6_11245 [Acidimicrobiales bacterium]